MARWIIPDVEPEAREAAKLAARKAGLSVGDWLTQTILSAAANELKSSARGMGGSRNPYYSPPPALTHGRERGRKRGFFSRIFSD
ncbi:MAG: hypothetical protein HY057_09715 [Rhodospirillales bacterium]|nr:hypothetical protein [Rhodospirillales bacterium]